ncbi:MAG TPA: biotin/lipoyl-binding protein, partial [Anaerolineae bacterium]
MKRIVRVLVIVAIVAAVGAGAYLRLRPTKSTGTAGLSTATVQVGSLSATVNAAGNIQAHQTADLTFGQSGTVSKINVKVGDTVKAGDVLGEINTSDLQLSLRSAQVSLKNAQDSLAQ